MSQLPPNPNIARNIIPEKAELPFLRAAASRKQETIDQLMEKSKAAHRVYTDLKHQHDAQMMVLERIQSHLHLAKDEMDTYEKYAAQLNEEMKHLHGQLHPIRRSSDDILQEIFHRVVNHDRNPFLAAARLSHVCQRWRTLAISTPSLWKCVILTTQLSSTGMASIVHAFVTRVRHVAADVTVLLDVSTMGPADFRRVMNNLHLHVVYSIPSLSTLAIKIAGAHHFNGSLSNQELLDAIHHFPARGLERLDIDLSRADKSALNPFLAKFLPMRNLEIIEGRFRSNGVLGLQRTLSNLVVMTMVHVNELPALSLLRMTPLLQKLQLRYCTIILPDDQPEDVCLLQHLTVLDIASEGGYAGIKGVLPWARIQCPVLKRIGIPDVAHGTSDEAFWEFLSSTATISEISSDEHIDIHNFIRLANTLPQITKLEIIGSEDLLPALAGSDQSGLQSPAFPCLLVLDIWMMYAALFADQLRELVYSRCLPRDHAQSTMNPQVKHPIKPLSINIVTHAVEFDAQAEGFLEQYFERKDDRYTFVQDVARQI